MSKQIVTVDAAREEAYRLFKGKLTRARVRGYICPVCGSGSGSNGTGMEEEKHYPNRYTCYACGIYNKDCYDIIAQMLGLEPRTRATMAAVHEYLGMNVQVVGDSSKKGKQEQQRGDVEMEGSSVNIMDDIIRQDINDAQKIIWSEEGRQGREYCYKRGLTDESIKAYGIGYIPQWVHPARRGESEDKQYPSSRVIIPRNECCYVARATDSNNTAQKMVAGRQRTVGRRAYKKGTIPIIVEGELDAYAIQQHTGASVVCIGSVSNIGLVADYLKAQQEGSAIVALDNDESGRRAEKDLVDRLHREGIKAVGVGDQLYGSYKDGAEACQMADFTSTYARVIDAAKQTLEGGTEQQHKVRKRVTTNSIISDIIDNAKSNKEKVLISTGLKGIDNIIGGGLQPQTMIVLTGLPGGGKTLLCQQICDSVRLQGRDSVYVSLEMPAKELFARSISRTLGIEGISKRTATEVLQQFRGVATLTDDVIEAMRVYARQNSGEISSVDQIEPTLSQICEEYKALAAELKAD